MFDGKFVAMKQGIDTMTDIRYKDDGSSKIWAHILATHKNIQQEITLKKKCNTNCYYEV